jgi:hypothetical protein
MSLSLFLTKDKKNFESSEMALKTIVLNKSTTAPSKKNSKYPKQETSSPR